MEQENRNGRPPVFESSQELQSKVDMFFRDNQHPTITGLCLYLGFESRQSFYDYEKRDGFSYTIRTARTRIENFYETKLMSQHLTGAIFALKNFGWADKQEIEQKTEHSGNVQITGMEIV